MHHKMSNTFTKCPNCGFDEIEEDDLFCVECGYNLHVNKQKYQNLSTVRNSGTDSKLYLNQAMIQHYLDIEDKIRTFENIEIELEQQNHYFHQLTQDLEEQEQKVHRLKATTEREYQDVEKLKNISWRSLKARLKGDKEAQLEREEYEYYEALNREETAIKQLEEIKTHHTTAREQLNHLQSLAHKKKDLQRQLIQILDKACEGVQDPVEDQIEQKLTSLQSQQQPLYREKSTFQNGLGHFQNAQQHLRRALNFLGGAGDLANWDTFFGGGFIADSMKHSRITDAQYAVQSADKSLRSAFQALPNAPKVTIPQVWHGSGIWDMMFDGFFSDMHVRQKIRESREEVHYTYNQVNQAIEWIQQRLSNLTAQLTTLNQQIHESRQELTKERKRMMEDAIR